MALGMPIHQAMPEVINHICKDMADNKVGINTDIFILFWRLPTGSNMG